MKHKQQPSQIIYSTKEISEKLHLLNKARPDYNSTHSIITQSNYNNSNNNNNNNNNYEPTQSYCSLYRTNSQKTSINEHIETINNYKTEVNKLQVENKEVKEKYIKSKTKISKIEKEYYPFEYFPKTESDYQVLFSFKFIDITYLFIKRTDKQFNAFYYWIKESDVKNNDIDYSELGLPGIYFNTFDNFINYYKLKEELSDAKTKLIENERIITRLQRKSYRSNESKDINDCFKVCNQTNQLSIISNNINSSNRNNSLIKSTNRTGKQGGSIKLSIDKSMPYIELLGKSNQSHNNINIDQLVQSWKEYEEEKPYSKELCEKSGSKPNEQEDINLEQFPAEIQANTSTRYINKNDLYEKLTQVILTYKTQLITKEKDIIDDYTLKIQEKDYMIQLMQKDNDQYAIENSNLKKMIGDLKGLMTIKEAEMSKVLEYESQINSLKMTISSLQQLNYNYLQTVNQKESQLDLKENKITSMMMQLKEKDNQIADYYSIIKKMSLNYDLNEKIELKEQSYPEDNIDDCI